MQMKNTSIFLPELDKGDNSLISTTNQTNYENEEDSKWSQDCKICHCSTLLMHKRLANTKDKKSFLCNDCHMASPGDYVNGTGVEKEEFIALNKTLHNNKKKDKHYCDKCRFTSKDLVQYKKHISQHEEIKFICSYCSFVSYTKGEFQRHLVKHTGTFPYKCEYCDYGAVRNDYVVKHTQRVHGSKNKKTHIGTGGKDEQSSKCPVVSLNAEHIIEDNAGFQKDLSNSSSNASLDEAPFEICTIVSVCYIDRDEPILSSNFSKVASSCDNVSHNASVEVEMLSPESSMLQPGLPLTVIAPPQLEVAPNSFAQIMEIKMVDGIQKLVLKLFQNIENHSECTVGSSEESVTSGVNHNGLLTKYSSNQTEPLVATLEKTNINPDCPKSKPDFIKNSSNHSSCSSHDALEQFSVPVPTHDVSGEGKVLTNCDSLVKGKLFLGNSDLISEGNNGNLKKPSCFTMRNSVQKEMDCPEMSTNVTVSTFHCGSQNAAIDLSNMTEISSGTNCSFIGGRKLPLITDQLDTHACLEMRDSCFNSKQLPSQDTSKGSSLHPALAHENSPISESYKAHNLDYVSNIKEGPFILSVFSLSSGVENIPEGINWDDVSTFTTDSTDLSQSSISPMFDSEDCKIPLTLLCDKVPALTMSSNHLDLDIVDATRKNDTPDKICETTNLRTAGDHLEKSAQFSLIPIETASETKCDRTFISPNPEPNKGMFLPQDYILDIPPLKQNCKTELLQRDTLHLQKNDKKSRDRSKSDAQINAPDCIPKTENLNCNQDIAGPRFQKSWLQKHSNVVSCVTENDNTLLVCPNILLEAVCLPVNNGSKKGCLKRTQISERADMNQKSRGIQKQMYLGKREKKNCTLIQEAGIYETHAPQKEGNSPNLTPKKKVFFPKKRKSNITEDVVSESLHTASPVFIPKGTILTVINFSGRKAASKNGDCSKRSKNIANCIETFLPRPVLFHSSPVKSHKSHGLLEEKSFQRSGYKNSKQLPNAKKQSKLNIKRNNRVNQDSCNTHLQRGILKGSCLTKKVKEGHLKDCFQSKKAKIGCRNSKQEPNSKTQTKLNIRRNNILINQENLKSHLQKGVLKRPRLTKKGKKNFFENKKKQFGCRNSKQDPTPKKQSKLNVRRNNILVNPEYLDNHLKKAALKRPRLTKKGKKEHFKDCFENKKKQFGCKSSKQEPNHKKQSKLNVRRNNILVNPEYLDNHLQKAVLKRSRSTKEEKEEHLKDCFQNKKMKVQDEAGIQNEAKYAIVQERYLRLIPVLNRQRIKYPRLNQPVVVMNHPDVDSLEIVNIMNTIKKYKGRVLRVFLSERTMQCLGVKQQLKRLTCANVESVVVREHPLKQSPTCKTSEQTVEVFTDESQQSAGECQIHEREYEAHNAWMCQGQPLLMATMDCNSGSLPAVSHS